MNILITGASGLIGTAMIKRLRCNENLIICQSRREHYDEIGVKWIKHDLLTDSWECLTQFKIEVVYHLAGQTSSYNAKDNPIIDLKANVLGLLNLLEYFKKHGQYPFIVIAGTATEVGLTDQLPINEGLPSHPVTFYDLSKLMAEMYLKQYVMEGFAKGCALRLSNVFGRRSHSQQRDRGILDKVFSRATKGQNIVIYGDGNFLRDYIFIDDVVSAFIAAAEHEQQTNSRVFYIGSGQGVLLKDAFLKVAELATRLTGVEVGHEYVIPPPSLSSIEYRNAIIDFSEFKKATGWSPQYDFNAGVEAAYRIQKTLNI